MNNDYAAQAARHAAAILPRAETLLADAQQKAWMRQNIDRIVEIAEQGGT